MSGGIVIVGAGLTGGSASVALCEVGYREHIVLIAYEPAMRFGRPPLSTACL